MARAAASGSSRTRRRAAGPAPAPPFWKRHRRLVVAGLVVLLVGLAVRLVVRPATDPVTGSGPLDAVVVFAGGGDAALQEGLGLLNAQVAPVLVLPGGTDPARPAALRLCAEAEGATVRCPELGASAGGRAEARAVGALADELGWRRIAVVTSRSELSRSALLLRRCTTAELARVAVGPDGTVTPVTVAAELGRYLVALGLRRAC